MILETLIGAVTGGASGVVGSMLGRAAAFVEEGARHKRQMELNKFNLESEIKLREIEKEMQLETLTREQEKMEASSRAAIAEIEANSEASSARAREALEILELETSRDLLKESYRHDTALGSASQWVVNILRLVRPILTLILLLTLAAILLMNPAERAESIQAIVYLATLSISWWFGDRSPRSKVR